VKNEEGEVMKDIEHTFVRQIMALMYARCFCSFHVYLFKPRITRIKRISVFNFIEFL